MRERERERETFPQREISYGRHSVLPNFVMVIRLGLFECINTTKSERQTDRDRDRDRQRERERQKQGETGKVRHR